VNSNGTGRRLEDYPEVMTPKMISEYLGIGYNKALRLIKTGQFTCLQVGNAYRVTRVDFNSWLSKPGLRKVL